MTHKAELVLYRAMGDDYRAVLLEEFADGSARLGVFGDGRNGLPAEYIVIDNVPSSTPTEPSGWRRE